MPAFQNKSRLDHQPAIYGYYINLNERGVFHADIRSADGTSIMTITNEEVDDDGEHTGYGEIGLVECGYMRHGEDLDGLCNYAIQHEIIPAGSQLLSAQAFESALEDDEYSAVSAPTRVLRMG